VAARRSCSATSPTLTLGRLATEAGLPDGVLNVVSGTGAEVGEPLLRHPAVAKIAFTGSVVTGRRVATVGAERLVPVPLNWVANPRASSSLTPIWIGPLESLPPDSQPTAAKSVPRTPGCSSSGRSTMTSWLASQRSSPP